MAAWLDGELLDASELGPDRDGALETVLVKDGRAPLWDRHLRRLRRSVEALGIDWTEPAALAEAALAVARRNRAEVVRVVAFGGTAITARRRGDSGPVALAVGSVRRPACDEARHKRTERSFYDAALAEARAAGCDDALLLGPDGEVWETCLGNVIVQVGDRFVTPALGGAVLPGIAREVLCERLDVEEREVRLEELQRSRAVWITNAVHGPRPSRDNVGPGREDELQRAWRDAVGC